MSAPHGHSATPKNRTRKENNVIGWIQQGFLVLAIICLVIGIKQCAGKDESDQPNGNDFQMYTVNQDGSMNKFGDLYSMDSVDRVNSHLEYNYQDTTRALYFISKGPIDIYFPSCRRPGTWIPKYYCGEGEVNWSGLQYCNGKVKVFKAKKKKCG